MKEARERLLDPIERVSEFLFGLFMALTFVGAVSVATDGKAEIRTMFIAALGCNLAWGLVDGVMYIVQNVVTRGRSYMLAASARTADADAGRELGPLPERPTLQRDDLLGGLGIFLMCVIATFPVVLPFMFFADAATAKTVSRVVALAMLFLGGCILGRYAGYGGWKAGLMMTILGILLVAAIMALGG
jgi:hypothetical protein